MISNESNIDYRDRYEKAQGTITVLQQELAQLKKLIFGSRQERFVPATPTSQLSLGIDPAPVPIDQVTKTRQISYTRSTVGTTTIVNHPGRARLPEHLRREEIIIEPAHIPAGSKKIGQEETEQLECVPAELYVKKYIRPKYLLAADKEQLTAEIIMADLPAQPIDKCIAGPGLLTQIIIDKYCDHLPLYRQMRRFERSKVNVPYSTITQWVNATASLISPLYEALVKETLKAGYLQADETPCAVLDKDKKGKTHRGYYWLYQDPVNKLVVFDYQEGRNKEGPATMLKNFEGILQTDGFAVYDNIAEKNGITLIHCLAHARRYFVDAVNSDSLRAEHVLEQIQLLYQIERICDQEDFDTDSRQQKRREKSLPILEELGKWMLEQYPQVLPKSPIGEALAYSIKRWEKLSAYAQSGILLPDNNKIENSVRPLALGRKNYLFAGSHQAARRAAILYSLLGTCKLHRMDPHTWLKDVLSKISTYPISQISLLLPHNWMQ